VGRRLPTALLAVTALVALAGGCGGGGGSSNGEADKPAATAFADAQHAALEAKSVHVLGSLNDAGKKLSLDLEIAQGEGKGTMAESGLSFRIVRIGDTAYIKGTDAFLRQFAGEKAVLLFHDKWLKGPTRNGALASLAPLTDIVKLFSGAFGTHGKLENKGETTFQGHKVVEIRDRGDGSRLYIAADGTPFPVAAKGGGKDASTITFGDWNAEVSIEAPKGAVDLGKLGG
jgi:hypothetical protein